jgi:hypothetical protein
LRGFEASGPAEADLAPTLLLIALPLHPTPPSPPRSNEFYALSVWGEGAPPFESLEVIARREVPGDLDEKLRELLHVVFGFSKDLCASGLRMGCLHSRSPRVFDVGGSRGCLA